MLAYCKCYEYLKGKHKFIQMLGMNRLPIIMDTIFKCIVYIDIASPNNNIITV